MISRRNNPLWETLPPNAAQSLALPWSALEPFYAELKARTLDAQSLEEWLLDWSHLLELILEIEQRLSVAKDLDTTDTGAEKRYLDFQEQIGIPSEKEDQALREALLASGLKPANFEVPLTRIRLEAAVFREENLPLGVEEEEHSIEYSRIVSTQAVQWNGKEVTLTELEQEFLNQDRSIRRGAWELYSTRQLHDVPALDKVWRDISSLRARIAKNAGFPNFREYQWKVMARVDYSPDDCKRFGRAILEAVVPAATRIYERHKRLLGLETLRPWDLMDGWYSRPVDPPGTAPLKPFTGGEQLASRSLGIFTRLDPQLGGHFGSMIREGLLDLETRKGKTPGAYCTFFDQAKRPFILMNAVGMHEDVQTMLHEAGHAFHSFESAHLPHPAQRNVAIEFAEVASMAMEHLAGPYLGKDNGGFYSESEARRARLEHMERTILFWPFMTVVDQFQHWVYENPESSLEGKSCSKVWDELWRRYLPAIDYSGHERYRSTGWQRKQHIYKSPLYYIEYGLAQLGALQVWKRSLTDPAGALSSYKRALRLGGTAPLPKLFETAGGTLSFDAATLKETVAAVEEQTALLRKAT